MRYTPDNITKLMPDEVFVFGSNLAGIHGAGAAKIANEFFGAPMRRYFGFMNKAKRCYAIPTKDTDLKSLPLSVINEYVTSFLWTAEDNMNLTFLVTPIGCGLAGYKPKQIAPMFSSRTSNVILPKSFHEILRA